MANEVFNTLTITGDEATLNQLKPKNPHDGVFSLQNLHPVPEELLQEEQSEIAAIIKNFATMVNYERKDRRAEFWRIQHWGTDRDVFCSKEIEVADGLWVVSFDSRWVPPLEALLKISSDFPGLTFTLGYWTCDSDFQGDAVFKDGECLQDDRAVWVPEEYEYMIPTLLESSIHPFVKQNLLPHPKKKTPTLREKLIQSITKSSLQMFDKRRVSVINEGTGEKIDANISKAHWFFRATDLCKLSIGDIVAYKDRRWRLMSFPRVWYGVGHYQSEKLG